MELSNTNRSAASLWFQAIRPFSLTATVIPVLLGAMITLANYQGETAWILMLVIALGSPLFQIAGNLISEYFDFKNKVDRPETFGSSRILVDGLMKPEVIYRTGVISLIALFLIGMILVYYRGTDMLIIGVIGIAASYAYSIFKYRAMGDLLIYLTFGPLMVFGTYFALTGSYMLLIDIAIISIPVGFLVVGILHANNTRDIKFDVESNIRTFASTIGFKASQNYYYFLVFGSYAAVVLFIALGILPLWSLLVFLSTPIAMKNVKVMAAGNPNDPKTIAMLDVMTAQLHLVFGVLLSISLLIEALV